MRFGGNFGRTKAAGGQNLAEERAVVNDFLRTLHIVFHGLATYRLETAGVADTCGFQARRRTRLGLRLPTTARWRAPPATCSMIAPATSTPVAASMPSRPGDELT